MDSRTKDKRPNVRKRQKSTSNSNQNEAEKKLFKCRKCNKTFDRHNNMMIHFQGVHEKNPRFQCPTCHKHYKYLSNLIRHAKAHSGENKSKNGRKVKRVLFKRNERKAKGNEGRHTSKVSVQRKSIACRDSETRKKSTRSGKHLQSIIYVFLCLIRYFVVISLVTPPNEPGYCDELSNVETSTTDVESPIKLNVNKVLIIAKLKQPQPIIEIV